VENLEDNSTSIRYSNCSKKFSELLDLKGLIGEKKFINVTPLLSKVLPYDQKT